MQTDHWSFMPYHFMKSYWIVQWLLHASILYCLSNFGHQPTCMLQYPWESFNYQKDLWSLPKVFTLPMWFPYILLKWNTGGTLCHVFILQINFVVSKIILRKQRIGSCLTAILYVVLPSIPCFHSLTSV